MQPNAAHELSYEAYRSVPQADMSNLLIFNTPREKQLIVRGNRRIFSSCRPFLRRNPLQVVLRHGTGQP